MENTPVPAAKVEAVQGKLQALLESLPDDEKPVLQTLLAHAADGGRHSIGHSGHEETSIIIVGGSPERLHIPLDPSVLVKLNPQPLPPVETEDIGHDVSQ